MSWTNGPFLGFDTETTGVDPATDRIVTAAIVHRGPRGTKVTNWLINPGVEIPESAALIHGVTTEQARTEGRDPAEALEEIASLLVEAQLEGVPVVAYNANFDLTILDAELDRHGLPNLHERLGRAVGPVLDPLVLDRAVNRFRKGSRRLVDLVSVYEVGTREDLHTADVDVEATLDILTAMALRHPTIQRMSLTQLHDWQVNQHRRWAAGYNTWRRKQKLEGPGAELTWPMRDPSKVA